MRVGFSPAEAALPWSDPSVERLGDRARARVGRYWAGRSLAELDVADAFRQTAAALADTGAEPAVLDLLRRAIANEHDHASLCRRLGGHYLGRPVEDPPARVPVRLPALAGASPEARPTLLLAGLCCINESIATIWLQACAARASAPLVRAVNRMHVRDEIHHARVGWAHLASPAVTPAIRAELGRWLRPLLRSCVLDWLSPRVVESAGGVPDHGLPTAPDHREVVIRAVRSVVLPGFALCGVDVERACAWLERIVADEPATGIEAPSSRP